jgi:hypothetical protein
MRHIRWLDLPRIGLAANTYWLVFEIPKDGDKASS